MWGAAIEVPLILVPYFPESAETEYMVSPGAEMSGFGNESIRLGPRLENEDGKSIRDGSAPGSSRIAKCQSGDKVTLTDPDESLLTNSSPSDLKIIAEGMVMVGSLPPISNGAVEALL